MKKVYIIKVNEKIVRVFSDIEKAKDFFMLVIKAVEKGDFIDCGDVLSEEEKYCQITSNNFLYDAILSHSYINSFLHESFIVSLKEFKVF